MPDPIPPIPMQIPAGYGLWTGKWKSIYGPKVFTVNLGFKSTLIEGINMAEDISFSLTSGNSPGAPANYTDRFVYLGATALFRDDVDLIVYDYPRSVPGTGTWESPPINTAILVQKITGIAGRRNKGRFYWPSMGVAEADVDNLGVINTSRRGLLQVQWDDFFDAMAETAYIPYMLHGGTKANPTVAPIPTRITSYNVELMCATQRRRMR